MKNFKFEKPFSSFLISNKYRKLPLKEKWIIALHDPAFITITTYLLYSVIKLILLYVTI